MRLSTLTLLALAMPAAAIAAPCNIVGTFTDSLGSSGKFTSEKKGSVSNPNICSGVTFNLTVTKLTNKVVNIKGKPAKSGSGCTSLTGSFTFQNGGCNVASGNVTINPLGTFPDTITRTGKIALRPVDNTALTEGLK